MFFQFCSNLSETERFVWERLTLFKVVIPERSPRLCFVRCDPVKPEILNASFNCSFRPRKLSFWKLIVVVFPPRGTF